MANREPKDRSGCLLAIIIDIHTIYLYVIIKYLIL